MRLSARMSMTLLFLVSVSSQVSGQAKHPFSIEIAGGHSLRPDGKGPYRNDEPHVQAFGGLAITLCTEEDTCTTLPEKMPTSESPRALVFDLSAPVRASGAVTRGVVSASFANFGAFWGQDTTQRTRYGKFDGWLIRNALEIPVDSTVESERVELRFFNKGTQYILQFGPWVAGQYQPKQGPLNGNGTTRGTITRTSRTTWVVRSGAESVGRLWHNRNPAKPVDRGLYRFSYEVRYSDLVKP